MIVHGCILCLFFVYFALISSRLEDEVEENEKFQLIVDFFFFACFSLVLVMGVQLCRYLICLFIFSSVRYLSLSVYLSVSVITVLSCSCHLALSGIFGKGIYSIIQVQQAIYER